MVVPGVGLKLITLVGARNLLMSEVKRFESPTPTSGPGAVLRKVLLDDEAGRARSESVLVAAEIGGGAGFGDAAGDFQRGRRRAAYAPDAEHVAFAIGYGDDAVRGNLNGAGDRLIDHGLHVHGRELRLGDDGPEQQGSGEEQWNAESHGGALILKLR